MVYNYFISILIITCSLLIPTAFSIGDTELGHICLPNNTAFTIAFNQSRALVAMDLIINTASSDGFRTANYTWLKDPNEWAYGLALCRGDVSPDDCKTCVNNAALTLIYTLCPDSRAAIIWRDYCFVKYSEVDFFGKIDTDNEFSTMGDSYWYELSSESAARSLMGNLSQSAIQSTMLYAHNTSDINDDPDPFSHSVKLYGLVQCTRDLSPDDCWACLNITAKLLPTFKKGGRVVTGSCNMRYETYDFLSN